MIIQDYQLFNKIVPSQVKLLAIDVGTKRLGLATCDELRFLTTPRQIITRQSNEKDFAQIKNMCEEYRVVAIIIGFPINMDGSLNPMSQFTLKFSAELDEFLQDYKIFYADERLTSFEAKDISMSIASRKSQKHYDDIAASVILRDFIDLVKMP